MNRCRHDIINDMLGALSADSRRITDLCMAGNVPVDRGKGIVEALEKYGLIIHAEEAGEIDYRITDRGYEWLGLFRMLRKVLP